MIDWEPLQPRLEALAAQGLTASEIARRLGRGISRNAVIGRAYRTKVALRPQTKGAPLSVRKPARTDDVRRVDTVFRIALLAEGLLSGSMKAAAQRQEVSVKAVGNWRRDAELVAQAEALAASVRARTQAAEARRREAAPPAIRARGPQPAIKNAAYWAAKVTQALRDFPMPQLARAAG